MPSANNIVTNVDTTVSVKGDGKSLGLTDGTNLTGLSGYTASGLYQSRPQYYGGNVGATSQVENFGTRLVGITTDPTKSGVIGTVTRSVFSVRFIIKF